MSPFMIVNLAAFAGLVIVLFKLGRPDYPLSRRILAGLVAGVGFGFALQIVYAGNKPVITATLEWTNVVGTSYVNLLKMTIMPLVLIMMIAAVVRMRDLAALGRIGGSVIGILVATTMIAALVGILVTSAFGLSADGLTEGARELERAEVLIQREEGVADLGLADPVTAVVGSKLTHRVLSEEVS